MYDTIADPACQRAVYYNGLCYNVMYTFCGLQAHDIDNFKTINKQKLFTQNYCKSFWGFKWLVLSIVSASACCP